MSFIEVNTDNPLGKRPLNLMARQQGMGWFSSLGAAPTPGDYDNNQAVLNQLVSMGAISFQDATDIFNGQASLDDMAVNMTMINQALQLTGQVGTPTVTPIVGPTQAQAAGTVDASSESSWNSVLSYLQAWNTNLKQLMSIAMQHPNDSAWTSFDRDLLSNQNSYNSLVNQYGTIYRAVYGHMPSGLEGFSGEFLGYMGQFDPATAAVYAAVLSAILIAAVAGYEYTLTLQTRAQSLLQQQQTAGTMTNQAATLRQQAAAAQAQGNTVLANSLTAQANALQAQSTTVSTAATTAATASSFTAFLQNNMALLAAVAIGIVVLPPLIKKI
jgi:hypothetical protein